jgi:hypothetical protein
MRFVVNIRFFDQTFFGKERLCENLCNLWLAKQTQYKELTVFYQVYNKLGYGFLEKVYENAMMIKLIFGTKPEVKRKAFDNLKYFSA